MKIKRKNNKKKIIKTKKKQTQKKKLKLNIYFKNLNAKKKLNFVINMKNKNDVFVKKKHWMNLKELIEILNNIYYRHFQFLWDAFLS